MVMNRKILISSLSFLLIIYLFGCVQKEIPQKYKGGNQHAVYESPNKDYFIVIYRIPMEFSMPGGASDAPGIVCLYNAKGEMLKEKKIEMIQLMEKPEWSDKNVSIKLFADWDIE